jgi:hypothetical protein
MLTVGQRVTWPALNMVKNRLTIEVRHSGSTFKSKTDTNSELFYVEEQKSERTCVETRLPPTKVKRRPAVRRLETRVTLKCPSSPMPTLASQAVHEGSNTPRTEVYRQETYLVSRPNPLGLSGVESHRCDLRHPLTAPAPRQQSPHRQTWMLIDPYRRLVSANHQIVATLLPYPMPLGMSELAHCRLSVRTARHSALSGLARIKKSSQPNLVRRAVYQSVDGLAEHPSQAVRTILPMMGIIGDRHQGYPEMMLCLLSDSLPKTKWLSMTMSPRMRVRYLFLAVSGLILRS